MVNDPLQQSATDKSGPFLDGTTPAIEFLPSTMALIVA
jgi:hypothetical protein